MKRIKKLLAVLLAVVMVASMGSMSVMADGTTYTITINNSTSGYTYAAYQIFKGDLSGSTLSNVDWGTGVDGTKTSELITALKKIGTDGTIGGQNESNSPFYNCTDAKGVAEALAKCTDDSAVAQAFAGVVAGYLTSDATGTADSLSDDVYEISGLTAGYYLVKATTVPANGSYTRYILEVVGNVTVTEKKSVPSVTKTVTGTVSGNETNATSASAGDKVSFTLTATMPSTYADYSTYALTFHDTLSTNLAYDTGSVVVTVNNYEAQAYGAEASLSGTLYVLDTNGAYVVTNDTTAGSGTTYYTCTTTVASSGYTVTTPSGDDCNLKIAIDDTNALENGSSTEIAVDSTTTIVVTYTATVNADISSTDAETNSVVLEYSNNPNGTGTGKTTEEKVYVYTYDLDVYKTDEDNNGLSGASFTLYKKVSIDEFASETTYYTLSSSTATAMTQVTGTYEVGTDYYVKVGNETSASKSENSYIAEFNDLGEGDYVLAETVTPAGYNTAAVVKFTISATYASDGSSVTTLSGGSSTGVAAENNSTSTLKTTVVNNSGSTIPSTGGIGTTIFYVVGAILVVGAAVILVTRRRMQNRT